jgi:hypothetical protein
MLGLATHATTIGPVQGWALLTILCIMHIASSLIGLVKLGYKFDDWRAERRNRPPAQAGETQPRRGTFMKFNKRRAATVAVTAAAFIGLSQIPADAANQPDATSAPAPGNSVTSASIVNGTILQQDVNAAVIGVFRTPAANSVSSWNVRDNGIYDQDLHSSAKKGRVSAVEADGPYPGETQLGDLEDQGSNSAERVYGDEGASVQEVWVKCAPGKTALGGGFTLAADASLAAKKQIQVVASEATGAVIEGDLAWSLKPTGWKVEVINSGTTDVIVRPWVICAKVS